MTHRACAAVQEVQVARRGKAMDPNAGSRQLEPVFEQTSFQLDYLTRPNAFSDMGFDFGKVRPSPLATLPYPTSLMLLFAVQLTDELNGCPHAHQQLMQMPTSSVILHACSESHNRRSCMSSS